MNKKKDINFFAPFLTENRPANRLTAKTALLLLLALILCGGLIGMKYYTTMKKTALQAAIDGENAAYMAPETQEALNEYLALQAELDRCTQYVDALYTLTNNINAGALVNDLLLRALQAALPPDTAITAININETALRLEAVSADMDAAAAYQHNLAALTLYTIADQALTIEEDAQLRQAIAEHDEQALQNAVATQKIKKGPYFNDVLLDTVDEEGTGTSYRYTITANIKDVR